MKISDNKPIVGRNVFRHESGIHVDAVLEEPLTYEPFLRVNWTSKEDRFRETLWLPGGQS
jgi:hypothetical protein